MKWDQRWLRVAPSTYRLTTPIGDYEVSTNAFGIARLTFEGDDLGRFSSDYFAFAKADEHLDSQALNRLFRASMHNECSPVVAALCSDIHAGFPANASLLPILADAMQDHPAHDYVHLILSQALAILSPQGAIP